jgi:hypothetical protein
VLFASPKDGDEIVEKFWEEDLMLRQADFLDEQ